MKYLLIILPILLLSCSMNEWVWVDPWDFEIGDQYYEDYLFVQEIKKADGHLPYTMELIRQYVTADYPIKYKADHRDFMYLPADVLEDRVTECQGKSLLMIGLFYKYLGIKANYIAAEGSIKHAIVEYEGVYYDSTNNNILDMTKWKILKKIPFDKIADEINKDYQER